MTLEEYNKKKDEMLEQLPPEFRAAVAYHAWESGHSAGYQEVLIHLDDLIDMLKEPIRLYSIRWAESRSAKRGN